MFRIKCHLCGESGYIKGDSAYLYNRNRYKLMGGGARMTADLSV